MLGEVVGLLGNIKGILGGLEYRHFHILGTLQHGHQMLHFLQSEKDIVGQIALLTQVY